MAWSSEELMAASPEMLHRADFTFGHYRELLRLAKKHWTFRSYTNFERSERFVIWRHDVDLSMAVARRQAGVEREEGVSATYFINPHSEYYNLGERSTAALVREIIADGHEIGLHFDSHFYGIDSESQLETAVRFDAELLERWFDTEVRSFSFHNTTPFVLGCREWRYGGRINAYAEYFQKEVGYCSDSNGFWRHRRLHDVLAEGADPRLQVLTHDGWWTDEIASPRACVQQTLSSAAKAVFWHYRRHLARHGMRDVSEMQRAWEILHEADVELAERVEWLYHDGTRELALLELWRSLPANARAVLAATTAGMAATRTVDRVLRSGIVKPAALNAAIAQCIALMASGVEMDEAAA